MIRIGLVIVTVAIVAALLGPVVWPYDSSAQELARNCGTGRLGRAQALRSGR